MRGAALLQQLLAAPEAQRRRIASFEWTVWRAADMKPSQAIVRNQV
jgi:hypothetical protein